MKKHLFNSAIAIWMILLVNNFSWASNCPQRIQSQFVIQSKIDESTTVQFEIDRNEQTNSVTISGSYLSSQSGDIYAAYLLDGAYFSGLQVTVPVNNGTYWYISFDYENEEVPVIVYTVNNPVCYDCQCPCVARMQESSEELCNKNFSNGCVYCTAGSCLNGSENCCKVIEVDCPSGGATGRGTGVFIQATDIYFNDVHYVVQ